MVAVPIPTTPLWEVARLDLLPVFPNFTIGPGWRKQTAHTDWKQYKGVAGIVGTPDEWRRASSIYIMAADELGAVLEYDDPALQAEHIAELPILVASAGWTRTDSRPGKTHGGHVVHLHHKITDKAHPNIADADSHEQASLRRIGAIQLVLGRHWDKKAKSWSGNEYIFNGLPVVELSADETDRLAALFGLNEPTHARTGQTLGVSTIDDWQAARAWRYIDEYLDTVKTQRAGRNQALNDNAYQIGRLAHYVNCDDRLVDLLFDAAQVNGYVQKDGPAAALATIRSGFAAGKGKRRYPFTRQTNPTTQDKTRNIEVTPVQAQQMFVLPFTWEAALRFCLPKRASAQDAVIDVINAGWGGSEPCTLRDLAGGDDPKRKRFHRAIYDYGADSFFDISHSGAVGQNDQVFSSPLFCPQIPDQTDQPHNNAKYFRLKGPDELKSILLDKIVGRMFDLHRVPWFCREQIEALGVTSNLDLAAEINLHIKPNLTDVECAEAQKP